MTSHTDQGPVERKYQFADANINHLTFVGRGGDDRFTNHFAAPGNIKATGGDGDDTLESVSSGGWGHLYLYGDDGKDFLKGGDRNDFLDGGRESDWLEAGDGNDVLDGGFLDGVDDVMIGGLGADQFRAEAYVDAAGGVSWYAPPFTDSDPAQGDWLSTW
jgi:Ca2+-binding RTX toxin-like protein